MEKTENQYYPNDTEYSEIIMTFIGNIHNPRALKYYLNLLYINKKLKIDYPNYDTRFSSFCHSYIYTFRTILNDDEKISNAKLIFNKIIKYEIKSNSKPLIEIRNHGKRITVFTLEEYLEDNKIRLEEVQFEEYLENNKIKLEEIQFEELIKKEKNLVK